MIFEFNNKYNNEILRNDTHIYVYPNKLINSYVAHYTICFKNNVIKPNKLTLIPDASGCMVFTYNGSKLENKLYGPTTKIITVNNNYNDIDVRIFVEFFPAGISKFINDNKIYYKDNIFLIKDINKKLDKCINEIFELCFDIDEFIQKLDIILLNIIEEKNSSNLVYEITRYIKNTHGINSVKNISNTFFYSERHLNRLFNEHLGINIKTLSRLVKVNSAIKSIKENNMILTDISNLMQYYDQPHFIHEFYSICKTSPEQFIKNMSVFYNEPIKI